MKMGEAIAIIVAVIAASGAWLASRFGRVASLEKRVATLENTNRRLWLHLRAQIDHSYRNHLEPLPIPDDLFGQETT